MLLTRLSAGRFHLVIIFRPRPDPPAEPQMQRLRCTMIPANCADKFKGLEIANNGFTEVDLPANVRQRNNNSWNGRVVYWFGKTNMINWLPRVMTVALEINPSTVCGKRRLISAADMPVCAVSERWIHLFSLKIIYFSVISGAKGFPLVTMTIFVLHTCLHKPRTYESTINNTMSPSFQNWTKRMFSIQQELKGEQSM